MNSIDAFNDVKPKPLLSDGGLIGGKNYLDSIDAMQVGFGSKVFRTDKSGIWLGGKKFSDAVFGVDMNGKIISKSLSGTAGITINGTDRTIIVNDGTNDRILIGFQSGGF